MKISTVYDSGAIVPPEVFNIDPASLLTTFQSGIKNLAALSLEGGYPIEATVPLIIGQAFKNIAALSLESGYFFFLFFRIKIPELSLIASSKPAESVPEAKTTTKAPVKEEKPVKKEEPKVE